jgi:ArsR family transcriptional regulator, arsenate/arsenite/antimonite-responsive transcriptional repressor
MDLRQIEKISKALGDETRLRIFEAIATGKETNCGDLVALRGVTHATVSHHLKVLSEAGLIESRRDGQFVYNHAIPETLQEYSRALGRISRARKKSRSRRSASR